MSTSEESDDEEESDEHGDDADARWDQENMEWVLLPSAEMITKFYGMRVYQ